MKKQLLTICAFLALITGIALHWTAGAEADAPLTYDAESVYRRSGAAVFYLRALNADGGVRTTGTGVVLSAGGAAATAYHVVKGADRLEAVFPDGTSVSPVTVVAYDESKDAAVLALPKRKSAYPAMELRADPMAFGAKAFAIGYPLKETPIITEGIVNNPAAEINGRDRLLVSAAIASGMSGGPIVDEEGRIAGIVSGSLRTMNNIHLGVEIEEIRKLLAADE
ncbi:trypsin-like peptidase domain-containing protein [Paenibacillus antri]|uniref:Trypsin-like peptidase domain-containing protein n=1 Tax=Paenibacillus antri TaxID=2582848 RepID=A0A5R9GCZ7_9BACL|nr:serine protease [Paenibacillus antri]TLS51044.1 trypsin-like peptidase domain-containing protein [Paenibacillus antri]